MDKQDWRELQVPRDQLDLQVLLALRELQVYPPQRALPDQLDSPDLQEPPVLQEPQALLEPLEPPVLQEQREILEQEARKATLGTKATLAIQGHLVLQILLQQRQQR